MMIGTASPPSCQLHCDAGTSTKLSGIDSKNIEVLIERPPWRTAADTLKSEERKRPRLRTHGCDSMSAISSSEKAVEVVPKVLAEVTFLLTTKKSELIKESLPVHMDRASR